MGGPLGRPRRHHVNFTPNERFLGSAQIELLKLQDARRTGAFELTVSPVGPLMRRDPTRHNLAHDDDRAVTSRAQYTTGGTLLRSLTGHNLQCRKRENERSAIQLEMTHENPGEML
jgi:hypothetical protein